ncbi:MAG TPA: hypothetical protein VFI18_03005 [Gaiellales bacterium]|nr:hypothetical protein [Gaiellales bacterium]
MSRALSRSLAVVALLAVVSAALVVVTPSLARIVTRDRPQRAPHPTWLWESHVYGGSPPPVQAATVPAKHGRRPCGPPVARWSQP